MYESLGKFFGQYKSFTFGSVGRTAISGLQQKDGAALSGLMGMVLVGGMVSSLKDIANGRETPDSLDDFLFNGFDQSGAWGWAGNVNSALEALSDNGVGMRPLLGIADPWGSSLQWKTGALLGPTAGQAVRAGGLAVDTISGDLDFRSAHNAYKFVPLQNWYPLKMYQVARAREWFEVLNENDNIGGIRQ